MKKLLILFLLVFIVFSMASCGGSGSGSSSSPPGGDPNVAFYVKLRPSHVIAQTNTFIYFHARVLNEDGNPIPNVPVYFTNISPIGTFDVNPPVVNTDQYGYATVKLLSTTSGFATVQAEVNTGSGQVRDRRTVFFSVSMNLTPFMYLDVDGDNDGNYDEASDFILFESPSDNQVFVRATVFDKFGQRASGSVVTFGADWPYKIGSSDTCSDGSSTCEVSFPLGNTATTDIYGQAFVLVRVDPITIRNITTILNITASADNGAAGMVTLFLEPVVVSSVTVSADPTSVETGGTSTITAAVALNSGGPAPEGTTVSFTANCGIVEPFAQTTDGMATAQFTAPDTEGTCTITATVGVVSGSTTVTVTAPPDTTPPEVTTTIPADGATGIALDSTVTINWSEDIACSTVNTTNITISPSSPPTWTRTSCSGSQAVFTPSGQVASTPYTVTVGTGVTDLAGNPMSSASTFSYTTP